MNDIDPRPYKERLETVHHTMIDRLHGRYASEAEFENIIGFGYDYSTELEAFYLEIGLQIGMPLGRLILSEHKSGQKTIFRPLYSKLNLKPFFLILQ